MRGTLKPIHPHVRRRKMVVAPTGVIVVWIIVFAMDLTTTYLGLSVAWSIASAGILAAILTLGPEWLLKSMWHLARHAPTVGLRAVGIVGTCISVILWPVGARYTVDGVIVVLNMLFRHFTLPYQLPIPLPLGTVFDVLLPVWYLALLPIPILFSIVEWQVSPVTMVDDS